MTFGSLPAGVSENNYSIIVANTATPGTYNFDVFYPDKTGVQQKFSMYYTIVW
jgi:hypothetical protein